MASIMQCIMGGVCLLAGLWGLAAPPVLVLFEPNYELSIIWSLLGAVTLLLALYTQEEVMVFWMRSIGCFFLLLSIAGFSFDTAVLGIFPDTLALNLLHLSFALGFFWDGFVNDAWSRATPKDLS